MGKSVAIVQSNYVPWKGYFDLVRRVDEFVILDDVQYTARDWRNRNRIKTAQGTQWITIPVEIKGRQMQTIRETRVADSRWSSRHWTTIRLAYSRASFFAVYSERIEALYRELAEEPFLHSINRRFLDAIAGMLGIDTPVRSSGEFELVDGKTSRLVSICRQAGATTYLSGPAAKAYLDQDEFRRYGINVEWMDYSGYQEYPQLYPPFEHAVSVLDLIFNAGPDAAHYF